MYFRWLNSACFLNFEAEGGRRTGCSGGRKVAKGNMKNKLQYVYSILVFFGALVTSYLMMDREGNARIPLRIYQGPYFRSEAVVVDPALNRLMEMENELRNMRKEKIRIPTLETGKH